MQQLRGALSDEDDTDDAGDAAVEPSTKRRRCASGAGACAQGGRDSPAEISDAEAREILHRLAKELAALTAAVEPENTPRKLRLLPAHDGSASLKTLPSYLPLLAYLQRRGARAAQAAALPAELPSEDNTADASTSGAATQTARRARNTTRNQGKRRGPRGGKKKRKGGKGRWQRGGRRKRGRYARRHGRRRRRPRPRKRCRGTRLVLAKFSLLPVPPPGKVAFWRLNQKATPALRDVLTEELKEAGEQSSVEAIFGMKITSGALVPLFQLLRRLRTLILLGRTIIMMYRTAFRRLLPCFWSDTPVLEWFLKGVWGEESRRARRHPHGRKRVAQFAEEKGLRAAPPLTDGMQVKLRLTTKSRSGGGGGGGRPPKLTPTDRCFWEQSWSTILSEVEAQTQRLTAKELVEGVLPPVLSDRGLAHALGKGKASQRPHRVKAFLRHFKMIGDVDPGGNFLWQGAAPTRIRDVLPRLEAAARAETNDEDAWQPRAWTGVAADALQGTPWQISARDSRDYKKTRQSAQVEASWRRETHADLAFADLQDSSLQTVRHLFRKHWQDSSYTMDSCSSIRSLGLSCAVAGRWCRCRPICRDAVPTLAQPASISVRWSSEVALLALLALSVHPAAHGDDGEPISGSQSRPGSRPGRDSTGGPGPHLLWDRVVRPWHSRRPSRTPQGLSQSPGPAGGRRGGPYG